MIEVTLFKILTTMIVSPLHRQHCGCENLVDQEEDPSPIRNWWILWTLDWDFCLAHLHLWPLCGNKIWKVTLIHSSWDNSQANTRVRGHTRLGPGVEPSPCFSIFLARTTFVLESLPEAKNPGQDAIFEDFVFNSSNRTWTLQPNWLKIVIKYWWKHTNIMFEKLC